MYKERFGQLTLTSEKRTDKYGDIGATLDYIFDNTVEYKLKFSAIESDNTIAMRRLDVLTNTLRTKSLRNKSKSYCSYFML